MNDAYFADDQNNGIDALIAQRIRSAIAHLSISNEEMARELALELKDWEAMLAGRKRTPAATLVQIAELTGIRLASFFTGDFVAKH